MTIDDLRLRSPFEMLSYLRELIVRGPELPSPFNVPTALVGLDIEAQDRPGPLGWSWEAVPITPWLGLVGCKPGLKSSSVCVWWGSSLLLQS
jgi:hypothetical protein